MGRDCLWDSEEQHRKSTAQLICSLFLYGTRLPLGQRGKTYGMEWNVLSLFCSSLSQRQSCPTKKWGVSVLRGSPYGENCVRDDLTHWHSNILKSWHLQLFKVIGICFASLVIQSNMGWNRIKGDDNDDDDDDDDNNDNSDESILLASWQFWLSLVMFSIISSQVFSPSKVNTYPLTTRSCNKEKQ